MKVMIGICDTGETYRKQMTGNMIEYASSRQYELKCRNYTSAEAYLQSKERVDILLLDTELEEMSGIGLKDWLGENGNQEAILFISSHQERMRDAFGRNVYGFLEKPVQKNRLFACLDKIMAERTDCVQIRLEKERYISSAKVMYIKSMDKYVELHTIDSVEVGYISMKELQRLLAGTGFKRVQKGYMIHFDYVAKIGTEIVMKDGKVIRPMRGTVKVLKKEYYDYIQWKLKKWGN